MSQVTEMTDAQKSWIDNASYVDLLRKWRFGGVGNPIFQGECGKYYVEVMERKRAEVGNAAHVRASKLIGWDTP